jgi:dienelactone hydrolase
MNSACPEESSSRVVPEEPDAEVARVDKGADVSDAGKTNHRLQLTTAAPTGEYEVGTVSLHLIDSARQDPWWSTPHARELMITVWYPAEGTHGGDLAPWMTAGALSYYRTELIQNLTDPMPPNLGFDGGMGPAPDGGPGAGDGGGGAPNSGPPPSQPPPADDSPLEVSLDGVDFPVTHARIGAPARVSGAPYPIVLYAPGFPADRETGTMLVEDLASHGYVVVTIGFTYDAPEVEFPGGRVELKRPDLDPDGSYSTVKTRVADARFVLDQLIAIAHGTNPDAERHALPARLRACMDTNKVGIFGHSLGGAAAAQSMANDARFNVGINLDGHVVPTVSINGLSDEELLKLLKEIAEKVGERPFMIMSSGGRGPDELGVLMSGFWSQLHGWRRFLSLAGAAHGSYTDEISLLYQLAQGGAIEEKGGGPVPSTRWSEIDPLRAVEIERVYIKAFFELHLRNRDNHLLDGLSGSYPEIAFH